MKKAVDYAEIVTKVAELRALLASWCKSNGWKIKPDDLRIHFSVDEKGAATCVLQDLSDEDWRTLLAENLELSNESRQLLLDLRSNHNMPLCFTQEYTPRAAIALTARLAYLNVPFSARVKHWRNYHKDSETALVQILGKFPY